MKIKIFTFIVLAYLLPTGALAADIYFIVDENISASKDFLVGVFLDTDSVPSNAVEGTVTFPQSLELKEVLDGNSAINFWIKRPGTEKAGQVDFSGITAGGFSGPKIFLFNMVMQAKATGSYDFNFKNALLLRNDGLGTKVALKGIPATITVKSATKDGKDDAAVEDLSPPEDFVPLLGQDDSLFEGQYFAVFETVDKGSGISHFEVKESFFGLGGEYRRAESPYLIKDQKLLRAIYVKAIDKAGNERVRKISPSNVLIGLGKVFIFGIILLICAFFGRKIWQRFFARY